MFNEVFISNLYEACNNIYFKYAYFVFCVIFDNAIRQQLDPHNGYNASQ